MSMQNRNLVGVACHVMADMAYVIPDVVLPLAYERFQVQEISHSKIYSDTPRGQQAVSNLRRVSQ